MSGSNEKENRARLLFLFWVFVLGCPWDGGSQAGFERGVLALGSVELENTRVVRSYYGRRRMFLVAQ